MWYRKKLLLPFKPKMNVNTWAFGVGGFLQGVFCGFPDVIEVWWKAVCGWLERAL